MEELVQEILEFKDEKCKVEKIMGTITEGPFSYQEFKEALEDTKQLRQVCSE
jgi:hypothetical protein